MSVRLAIAAVLLGLFLVGAVFNLVSLIRRGRGQEFPSLYPLLPGLLGYAGVRLLPIPHAAAYAWLPPLLDVGCLPYLLFGLGDLAREAYQHRRRCVVMTLRGRHADGTLHVVTLYRNGDFILRETEMPHRRSRSPSAGSGGRRRKHSSSYATNTSSFAWTRCPAAASTTGRPTRTPRCWMGSSCGWRERQRRYATWIVPISSGRSQFYAGVHSRLRLGLPNGVRFPPPP